VERLSDQKISIRHWAEGERPREKLIIQGKKQLSDAELLAILIGSGTRRESALDLARKILTEYGHNLELLAQQSIAELQKLKGIGEAKALSITACFELGRRMALVPAQKVLQIGSSRDVFEHMQHTFHGLEYEEFWVMYLSRSNKVMTVRNISKGGVSGTVVDVRLVLRHGLELLASGMVLMHNHPSGAIKPSKEDEHLTQKIREAALLMDMQVLDHLIFGQSSYYSFSDEGKL